MVIVIIDFINIIDIIDIMVITVIAESTRLLAKYFFIWKDFAPDFFRFVQVRSKSDFFPYQKPFFYFLIYFKYFHPNLTLPLQPAFLLKIQAFFIAVLQSPLITEIQRFEDLPSPLINYSIFIICEPKSPDLLPSYFHLQYSKLPTLYDFGHSENLTPSHSSNKSSLERNNHPYPKPLNPHYRAGLLTLINCTRHSKFFVSNLIKSNYPPKPNYSFYAHPKFYFAYNPLKALKLDFIGCFGPLNYLSTTCS